MTEKKKIYKACAHLKHRQPDLEMIDEDLRKSIEQNFRVLPCYQTTMVETKIKKQNSLQTNQLLKCRWDEYRKHFMEKKMPFQFPNHEDLHFHNNCLRSLPSESVNKLPEHRFQLKPGPGNDKYGEIPIPNELLMKRGTLVKKQEKPIN